MSRLDIKYLHVAKMFLGGLLEEGHPHWLAGAPFTTGRLLLNISTWGQREFCREFNLPIFAVQGRDDHINRVELIEAG